MRSITIIKNTIKYWYLSLLIGIILIGVGFWAIFFPNQSIQVIAIVFSFTFLLTGIFEIIFSIVNKNGINNWGWGLALGIIQLIIGIILCINLEVSAFLISFCVGFIILFQSLSTIIIAINLKKYLVFDWGGLLTIGIIGFLFSLILLIYPHFTNIIIVIFMGLSLVISGFISIYMALKIKNIKSKAKKISSDLISRYEDIEKELENILRG